MLLDYSKLDGLNRYKLMSGSIVPRPVAWIVTEDNGVLNAAPFSYFIPLSSDPALVIVAIGKKDDKSPKDTLANILKNKKATVCFANIDNLEEMDKTAYPLDKDESEIERYSIAVEQIMDDYPAMISSTQTALFCSYFDTYKIEGDTTPIVLKIEHQFVADDRIDEKNHLFIDNIARVGASYKVVVDI